MAIDTNGDRYFAKDFYELAKEGGVNSYDGSGRLIYLGYEDKLMEGDAISPEEFVQMYEDGELAGPGLNAQECVGVIWFNK